MNLNIKLCKAIVRDKQCLLFDQFVKFRISLWFWHVKAALIEVLIFIGNISEFICILKLCAITDLNSSETKECS